MRKNFIRLAFSALLIALGFSGALLMTVRLLNREANAE